ncbi:MAG: hydrogenase maturation nickel metallochaperone HypA [Eubacteriales bacterium]|jgi:hydrogenase nickel incorporation protein HypA/HybF
MHEMSYAVRIADIALRAANENRILAVHVSCGEMLAIVPSLLETAFRECVKGTIAEHAELIVNTKPVRIRCASCGREIDPHGPDGYVARCPDCGSAALRIEQGREFIVDKIETQE